MKKIMAIASTGSKKSLFSKILSKVLNVTLVHLDLLYWNSDMNRVDVKLYINRLYRINVKLVLHFYV